jgi:hypothetical protein
MIMDLTDLEKCLEECIQWEELIKSKLNDAQLVEYIRLVSFVKATKYQHDQIVKMRNEGFFSQLLEEFTNSLFTSRRIAILQIERDLYSANVSIQTISKYSSLERTLQRFEEEDLAENKEKILELRLKAHLQLFRIKGSIIDQITSYKGEPKLPRSIYSILS